MPVSSKKRRPQIGVQVSFEVYDLDKETAKQMVLAHHYSGRCPGIKYTYGLYEHGTLVGCVVYSIPASYTLCNGVCGPEHRDYVLELARLVVTTTTPNAASYLVGRSLAVLPDHIIVSYADCNDHVGHVGYVYQATNWLYTGKGNAEPVYLLEADHPSGLKAGTPISYTRRHIDQKARDLGFDWVQNASTGSGLVRKPQVGKHRYVYLTGSKRFRRSAREALRYKVSCYPKGPTHRHSGSVMVVGQQSISNHTSSNTVGSPMEPKRLH